MSKYEYQHAAWQIRYWVEDQIKRHASPEERSNEGQLVVSAGMRQWMRLAPGPNLAPLSPHVGRITERSWVALGPETPVPGMRRMGRLAVIATGSQRLERTVSVAVEDRSINLRAPLVEADTETALAFVSGMWLPDGARAQEQLMQLSDDDREQFAIRMPSIKL